MRSVIGKRLVELCKQTQWMDAVNELYAPNIVSIEAAAMGPDMPARTEGIETIREIRREFPDVPIVAISGGGRLRSSGHLFTAKELGAAEILRKPLEMIMQYSVEQKITPRVFKMDELFGDATRGLS